MVKASTDNLLFGLALTAAAVSWGWFGWLGMRAAPENTEAVASGLAPNYTRTGRDAPESKTETWPAPKPQGGDWVYDVFTPPEIYYDPRTKEFSITAPDLTPPKPELAPFGLELLAVRQPLFRLQLVGFVGDEGSYRGLFQNTATTETFLAGAGRRMAELGLAIETFEVKRVDVPLPDSMTTRRRVATATVRDERTGETVALTDAASHYTSTPIATVAPTGTPADAREVREGETVELAGARFKIEKIQLAPPAAVVSKESADPLNSERRTVTLSPPDAAGPRDQPAP